MKTAKVGYIVHDIGGVINEPRSKLVKDGMELYVINNCVAEYPRCYFDASQSPTPGREVHRSSISFLNLKTS